MIFQETIFTISWLSVIIIIIIIYVLAIILAVWVYNDAKKRDMLRKEIPFLTVLNKNYSYLKQDCVKKNYFFTNKMTFIIFVIYFSLFLLIDIFSLYKMILFGITR